MNGCSGRFLVLVLALTVVSAVTGETVYLTNQFQVGLHQDKSPDTPIIKTIPSGTALELIKQEKNSAYVRDPQGVSGWIDNSYLVQQPPAGTDSAKLLAENNDLEKKLEDANHQISQLRSNMATSGGKDQNDLQQQLNAERIKTGELQIQLAELKKRLGQNNDTDSLYKQIEALKEKNMTLKIQLAGEQDKDEKAGTGGQQNGDSTGLLQQDWKRSVVYFFIYILIGMVLGIYILDYYNRRRHGGFRV